MLFNFIVSADLQAFVGSLPMCLLSLLHCAPGLVPAHRRYLKLLKKRFGLLQIIQEYENGKAIPAPAVLSKLSRVLGVQLSVKKK